MKMIGKNWKIITFYKDMLIYRKNDNLYFGNKTYTSDRPKNLRSAKNLITRYINKLSKKEKARLKYLKYKEVIK